MNINISNKMSLPSVVSFKSSSSQTVITENAGSITQKNDSTIGEVNGHAMLLSRLFHTNDLNANPVVLSSFTTDNLSGNSYSFLTMDDRKLMEKAYEYSTKNGIDPVQVDGLAFDLANYRFLQATGNNTGEITGIYDSEGYPWVGKFNQEDAAQAKQILTNPSIEATSLDKGFIASILNPQISGLNHAVSFDALEKFIPALSSLDPGQMTDNAKSPKLPVNADLKQALYRIDHPYVGAKWESTSTPPDNSPNRLWHRLGKDERKIIMAAYLSALTHGSEHAQKFLERITTLTGMSNLQLDGSSLQGMNVQKDKSATQSIGLLFQSTI